MTGRAADTFNTPCCGVIIVTIMSLNLGYKDTLSLTVHLVDLLKLYKEPYKIIFIIKIKIGVWTMGPLLAGWVDCSEGAIIHQLLVSQPSVQYIGDPQNGLGLLKF